MSAQHAFLSGVYFAISCQIMLSQENYIVVCDAICYKVED